MRRWNGWGDEAFTYPLSAKSLRFLIEEVGPGTAPQDASLKDVLATVPHARISPHPLISTDPEDRLRHSRGQSLPDWIALRSGRIPAFPDGVAYPSSEGDVVELLRYARATGTRLIPYGGGTSVVGHINVPDAGTTTVSVDMSRMSALISLDERSRLATFGPGVRGPELEASLRARGYTLGHYPQSFEYSTLGGWIHSRSSGQQCLGYGRIERLFSGGKVETPEGTLVLPPFPASAAGPDLKELVLGSEGRLGIMTEATVRVSPVPEAEDFQAAFFPDLSRGINAVMDMVTSRIPLSMLRLSTSQETRTTLAMAGHERLIGLLENYLRYRGIGKHKCMMIFASSGRRSLVRFAMARAKDAVWSHGGINVGRTFGREWVKNRFRTPYLRNTLWEAGYAADTLETATTWDRLPALLTAVENALCSGLSHMGEKVLVFSHLSHVYTHGSSIYTTYVFRLAADPEENLERWRTLKHAASQAIVASGGTISHHHGVGTDHREYLPAEKGQLGQKLISELITTLDPLGIMNPNKLV